MANNNKDLDNDQRSRRHNMDTTSPSTRLPLILWRFDNTTPSIMAPQNHRSSAGDESTSQQNGQENVDDHPSSLSVSLMPSLSIVEGNNSTMPHQMTNMDIVNILDEVMDIIADINDVDDVNKNEEKDILKKKD